MKVRVETTKSFEVAAKPLFKKYPSLPKDLLQLEKELIQTPYLGDHLGMNAYKIRLKIKSKGRGKSGGARVISLVETVLIKVAEITSNETIIVKLIGIYDKADVDTISDKELKDLIRNLKKD